MSCLLEAFITFQHSQVSKMTVKAQQVPQTQSHLARKRKETHTFNILLWTRKSKILDKLKGCPHDGTG